MVIDGIEYEKKVICEKLETEKRNLFLLFQPCNLLRHMNAESHLLNWKTKRLIMDIIN